jgi:hypothetical protein
MIWGMDDNAVRTSGLLAAVALLGLFLGGCGSGTQTADQALNKALETTGGAKENVGKFAGIVTIDGKPPGSMGFVRTLVILWDPQKSATAKTPPAYVPCGEDGKFEFNTYGPGDGVPTGSYVLCFAQLKAGLGLGGRERGWKGPDQLKNLYNDPDKNKDNKEFVVDISSPGKTDWDFNLEVTGKEAVANPGPNAFTAIH